MPVTKLYTFNLTCVILLVALYGVALNFKKNQADDLVAVENSLMLKTA